MMHYAQNPVSPETAILYPLAAERYFMALGDLKNAAFSRRLRVENRIGIAFDVLFDTTLFDLVEDLQNAWIDRGKSAPQELDYRAEDYDRAATAFQLAARDAQELDEVDQDLAAVLALVRTFPDAVGTFSGLSGWMSLAFQHFLPERAAAVTHRQAGLAVLGAHLLWKARIVHGAAMYLAAAARALRMTGERMSDDTPQSREMSREEGFVRYAWSLALLINDDGDLDSLYAAMEELGESIACFRRARGAFPAILHKRLSETHDLMGHAHHRGGNMRAAAYHFGQAREIKGRKGSAGIPEARVLPRRSNKGWKAALRSLLGKG
jgi:tetratricopeptide (TPR) repeat protein